MTKDIFISELNIRGIECTEEQYNALVSLMNHTIEMNEKFNLTAIKDPDTFMEKMIFDSALALIEEDLHSKTILDLGTGAGFPGLVLKILDPSIELTCLDATKKKVDNIAQYSKDHGLSVTAICDRAEDYARLNNNKFDYVIARAVSQLNVLMELSIPMVKVGGKLIAMKGPGAEDEINASQNAFKKLFCHLEKIYQDYLPITKDSRYIINIKKDKETIKKFPRDFSQIKKSPL